MKLLDNQKHNKNLQSPAKYEIQTQMEFEQKILQNGKTPAVVVFGADWSDNSQLLTGILENVLETLENQLTFFHVDAEKNTDLVDAMRIRSIPTTLVFHKGEVVDYFKGILSRKKVSERLNRVIKNGSHPY